MLVPEPVIPPGLIVQIPEAGRPVRTMLPVESIQVGCVIVPAEGAEGEPGAASITASAEAEETQPAASLYVKL